jgi:hypothetical protein
MSDAIILTTELGHAGRAGHWSAPRPEWTRFTSIVSRWCAIGFKMAGAKPPCFSEEYNSPFSSASIIHACIAQSIPAGAIRCD